METVLTACIVGCAVVWLARRLHGSAGGKARCSCGECPSRNTCGNAEKRT